METFKSKCLDINPLKAIDAREEIFKVDSVDIDPEITSNETVSKVTQFTVNYLWYMR